MAVEAAYSQLAQRLAQTVASTSAPAQQAPAPTTAPARPAPAPAAANRTQKRPAPPSSSEMEELSNLFGRPSKRAKVSASPYIKNVFSSYNPYNNNK